MKFRKIDWGQFLSVEYSSWLLFALVASGLAITVWSLSNAAATASRTVALQNAKVLAESVGAFRKVYTDQVVAVVEDQNIEASHLIESGRPNVIPLPINLSLEFARQIGHENFGAQIRIYSPYPFPWNPKGGLPDAIAHEQWENFSRGGREPIVRFQEIDGREFLRYATPDLMSEACTECHNSYEGTPRTDWQVGDVRGVLEIALPVDAQLAAVASDISSTVITFSSLGLLWLGTAAVSLRISRKTAVTAMADASRHKLIGESLQEAIIERELAEKEAHQLEIQIQHAQKLESFNVMTGGLAHDFNNLLVPILGNADFLKEEESPDSPNWEIFDEISTAANRAAELCGQMLSYAGKAEFSEHAGIDLNHVVEETASLVTAAFSKDLRIDLTLAKNLPHIQGDATKVGQVILNLLTNASEELTGGQGKISVRTGVHVSESGLGGDATGQVKAGILNLDFAFDPSAGDAHPHVFLEVEDDGMGMDEELVMKIFDPFFTTKFTGRGLGLATVQGVVRSHGGSIQVESEVDNHTRVRIGFPQAESGGDRSRLKSRESRIEDSWTGSGMILLADDESSVRRVARRMLEGIGFEVMTANDGDAAVRLFSRRPARFAAVVLDLTMPRRDGIETLQTIRSIRPDCPAILFSGYSEKIKEVESALNGITLFIQKPFRSAVLRDRLKSLLGESQSAEAVKREASHLAGRGRAESPTV